MISIEHQGFLKEKKEKKKKRADRDSECVSACECEEGGREEKRALAPSLSN